MTKYVVFTSNGRGFTYAFVEADSIEGVLASVKGEEVFLAPASDVTRARAQTVRTVTPVDLEAGSGPVNEAVTDPRKLATAFTLDH